MNNLRRKLLSLLTLFIIAITATAQTQVKGKVLDSETGESLVGCSVILMSADTTKMVSGTISGNDGTYNMKNVKDGQYVVKISFVGFHNFFHGVTINHKTSAIHNIGTTLLTPGTVELKQAVVTAQIPEMEVKEDTLVFNADAFRVPEGSVLEELVRKLPGVEVEDDGTIKVNGKTVKKILVDGKEFFGNDRNMSMKNLPTEIIDKIKTYDKQSDLTRITGIDDGNEETVMDLTIKKGMKKGWMGNVRAGYGTENRYGNNVNLNRFKDDFRVSLIGSLNNTNDRTGGGGGRGGNNGNTKSGMGGGNIVVATNNFELGGNARYNHNRTSTWTKSASQNFVSTRGSFSNSLRDGLSHRNTFASDFKIEWKPDSLTNVLLRPNVSVGNNDNTNGSSSATFNDDPYANGGRGGISDPLSQMALIDNKIKINENTSTSFSDGSNWSVGGSLLLNRRLGGGPWFGPAQVSGTGGRNVSLTMSGNASSNESRNYNFSNVIYHQRGDSTDITYRYRNTPSNNRSYSIGATYSEPVLRNLFAQLNYSYNYNKRHSDGQTFDFAKIDSIGQQLWVDYGQYGLLAPNYYEFLSDSLSRYTDNINRTHNLDFSLRYITQLLNISAGIRVERQNQEMKYIYQGLDTVASRTISRFSPTLNARFRFSRQHTLQLTFRGNSQQPEMTDMFNLTDNSNPLNIREGNPNLKPSFNSNYNITYNNFFETTKRSINANFGYTTTSNSISNRTEYNAETGGQVTRPENINGNWNINGGFGFRTPLFWEKFTVNTSTNASYNNRVSYIYQNKETMMNNVRQTSLRENLSFTLRLSQLDVRAYGNINWSKSSSEIVAATNQSNYNFHYGMSSTGNFENGLGYSTDIGINSRRGYAQANMNTNEVIWNAQMSYRFLQRRATVSLQAYDILRQRSNISRTISATSRNDSENNSINSYYMLSFQYRINVFGSRQGREALRQQRMEREGYERPDAGSEGRGEGGPRGAGGGGRPGGMGGGFGGGGRM